jgi:hypothetical protein
MKKPPVISEEEPEVRKVIKRVNIVEAPSMAELEEKINQFLETVAYNDLGMAETVRLYFFNNVYYAKMEYDLRVKK